VLKIAKEWNEPDVPLDGVPEGIQLVSKVEDVSVPPSNFIADTISKEIGTVKNVLESEQSIPTPNDSNQALANYLCHHDSQGGASTLLKGLQPHRGAPNKIKGKRFAAGEIYGDKPLHVQDNTVEELQCWIVHHTPQTRFSIK